MAEIKIKREIVVEGGRIKYKATLISEEPMFNPITGDYTTTIVLIADDYHTLESRIKEVERRTKEIKEQIEEAKRKWEEEYGVKVE